MDSNAKESGKEDRESPSTGASVSGGGIGSGSRKREQKEKQAKATRQEAVQTILRRDDKHKILEEFTSQICSSDLSEEKIKRLAMLVTVWFEFEPDLVFLQLSRSVLTGHVFPGFWSDDKFWCSNEEIGRMLPNPEEERERRKTLRAKMLRILMIRDHLKECKFRPYTEDDWRCANIVDEEIGPAVSLVFDGKTLSVAEELYGSIRYWKDSREAEVRRQRDMDTQIARALHEGDIDIPAKVRDNEKFQQATVEFDAPEQDDFYADFRENEKLNLEPFIFDDGLMLKTSWKQSSIWSSQILGFTNWSRMQRWQHCKRKWLRRRLRRQ